MAYYFSPAWYFWFAGVLATNVRASFPIPFELSFLDDPHEPCSNPQSAQQTKAIRDNVSLCFNGLQDEGDILLKWRSMFMSFDIKNQTIHVNLKVRQVVIFAPGASFTMAGAKPVSVFSRLRELEIGTHYNGYGEVSHPGNNSIIFKGQLNQSLFEGQIIYQSLNRSHTLRCFHNNSLKPAFYMKDECLVCGFTTYNSHHNPDSSVGWRSNAHPRCNKKPPEHGTLDQLASHKGPDPYSSKEAISGFPPTGFSDYTRDTPEQDTLAGNADDQVASAAEPPASKQSYVEPPNSNSKQSSVEPLEAKQMSTVPPVTQEKLARGNRDRTSFDSTRKDVTSMDEADSDDLGTKARQGGKAQRSKLRKKASRPVIKSTKPTKLAETQTPVERQKKGIFSRNNNGAKQEETIKPPAKQDRKKRNVFRQIARRVLRSSKLNTPQAPEPSSSKTPKPPKSANSKSPKSPRSATRPKSSNNQSSSSYTETISCPLHLVADHLFFSEIGEKNPARTVNLMLSVVIGADAVFRATDFDGDGVRDNIGFMVKNITIIHNSSLAFYAYSRSNGDSFQYLKSFSRGDFSDVCLGVAFTAIDFQRGVVGLAWYASSDDNGAGKGGICGQRVYLPNEGSSFSFNTAIVSFLNHGASVSLEKAILTMAHELGHCFGSTHDDMAGSPCNKASSSSSSSSRGSYLMQKYRPSEDLPNNYKFSPCSLRQIYPVIESKGSCLLRYTGPTCGNGVVEEGEECDCGLSGACGFVDPCCTPGDEPPSSGDLPCTVRRSQGLECSPVTFSCCSDSCKHIMEAERYVCREPGACYSQARCDGQSPLCPVSSFLTDGTLCHGGVRTCLQGRCRQSLCTRAGAVEECFCQDNVENLCKLCCRHPNELECRPAREFNITSALGHELYLSEGDACLHYRGVCASSVGHNPEETVCVTDEGGVKAKATALIGLRRSSKDKVTVTWFYWLCLIPIVMLPLLVAAALVWNRSKRGGWFQGGSQTRDSGCRLVAFTTAAGGQSGSACQDMARAPIVYSTGGSGFAFPHQYHYQFGPQRCLYGNTNAIGYERAYQHEARSARTLRNRPCLPRPQPVSTYSPRQVKFNVCQRRSKPSWWMVHSPPPQRVTRPLPNNRNNYQRYDTSSFPRFQPRGSNYINEGLHAGAERNPRHHAFHGSCRRLRANYSKPCIRTPLQRRRPLPSPASPRLRMTSSPPVRNRNGHGVGVHRQLTPPSPYFSDCSHYGQTVL